ncbi:glycoside hydrolase family 13 protein [Amanita rubescens]|nr:glycoside hydrolase family 13 protein [Amanita rubescens]
MPYNSLILFILAAIIANVFAATAEEWRGRSIYQVVTDRFATTDPNNGTHCDTSDRKYCGGTWSGLIQHLDYIQDLGFDAVWISPIIANIDGTTPYGEAYHGYWTRDLNSLNSHFGTADDLKALSRTLHERAMYLMIDIVVNHCASTYVKLQDGSQSIDYSVISPFNTSTFYHDPCQITQPNNQTNVEYCSVGDNVLPLPDLNTEDPTVVETLNTWVKWLVDEFNVDGLRIDTVKHVRKDFWPGFVQTSGVFTLGEVLSDSPDYVAPYSHILDALLDYPTYFKLGDAFATPGGNLSALTETAQEAQRKYANGLFMLGTFVENHDQPRFPSKTKDLALIKNAMTWPFALDGMPILYYGQEQGYEGGAEPSNREALWLTAYTNEKPLVAHTRALNAARRVAIAYDSNFLNTAVQFISQPYNNTIALHKPPMLTLLTNVGNNASSYASWTTPGGPTALFKQNEELVDVFTCQKVYANNDGSLYVESPSGMPQMLLPSNSLSKKGALCPGSAASSSKSGNGWSVKMRAREYWWKSAGGAFVMGGMGFLA